MYCKNPIIALKSQKPRNLHITNYQKLTNNKNSVYSDTSMLDIMIQQYNNWIGQPNVIHICYDDLYDKLNDIGTFLNVCMKDFPNKRARKSNTIELKFLE